MSPADLHRDFLDAMRRLAATVCVLTCRDEDGACFGMTATSVTSLSLDPPSVLACINCDSEFHTRLKRAAAFCVNILSDTQAEQSRIFGSGRFRDQRFARGQWMPDERTGAPLLDGVQANLVCVVDASFRYGTHEIIAGKARNIRLGHRSHPLIWLDRDFVPSGAKPAGQLKRG